LIAGKSDPDRLAQLAHRRVRASTRACANQKTAVDVEPFRSAIALLTTIPGVGVPSAEIILAEIDCGMSRFPTAGHLIFWAGLCPESDESAGKRQSTRMRKGALGSRPPLSNLPGAPAAKTPAISRRSFIACAPAAAPKRAIGALAASILTTVYHMLIGGELYHDRGPGYFDRRAKAAQTPRPGNTVAGMTGVLSLFLDVMTPG
jgi:transposase